MIDTFWIVDDGESGCADKYDALHAYLDEWTRNPDPGERATLVEHRRNTPSNDDIEHYARLVIAWMVDHLEDDERLGRGPEPYGDVTSAQQAAARVFVRMFFRDWDVYWGEPTGRTESVNLYAFARKHRPEDFE